MTSVVAALAVVALAVVPQDGGTLSFPQITINNSPGDQYDPHVDDDLAAYSSIPVFDEEIRYFRFSTGTDTAISNLLPDAGTARDLLSDVQGGRIVFSRIYPGERTAVMLFDAATATVTEINPTAGSRRLGVAIGGGTVAYVDLSLSGTGSAGEIVHWDVGTGAVTRLTNDAVADQNPAVSPAGDVIVWERCASSIVNCDVMIARRVAGAWTVSTLSGTAAGEANPDTNGTVVVYESARAGTTGSDIYWTPVAGGVEQRLELAGEQFHPTVSGNVIAFESRATGIDPSDIFLFDMATGRLFQVTNTALFNETLNDVSVLADGSIHIVWQANDEDGVLNNIYGASFTLPVPMPNDPPAGGGAGGGAGTGGGTGAGGGAGCGPGDDDDDDDGDDDDGDDDDGDDDDDDDDGDHGHHGHRCNGGRGHEGHHGWGHGHDDDHRGRGRRCDPAAADAGTGSTSQGLSTPDAKPMPGYGCSSSSGSAALPAFLAMAALLLVLRPRRVAIRVRPAHGGK